MEILYVFAALSLVLILWVISTTNRFVRLENLVRESWANVDVALKRRHNLIPNLVATAKGYADFEQTTLARLVELRNQVARTSNPTDLLPLENSLTQTLHRVIALAEGYPDLKASHAFVTLQTELIETEDRIAAARRFYDGNIREFNIAIASFPASLLAGGRTEKTYFQLDQIGEREPVKVSLK
jgi:LemA protein